jgi:hypothetical protein
LNASYARVGSTNKFFICFYAYFNLISSSFADRVGFWSI